MTFETLSKELYSQVQEAILTAEKERKGKNDGDRGFIQRKFEKALKDFFEEESHKKQLGIKEVRPNPLMPVKENFADYPKKADLKLTLDSG